MNQPARILIIDDEVLLLAAAARLLRQAGYAVIEAATGEAGLALAREQQPDLILLDVVLPDIDGVEVCRRLKVDPATSDALIVLLSGIIKGSDNQADGLEAGADGYLARPISNRELLARVKGLVRLKRAETALKEYSEQLEEMVEERTQDLKTAQEALIRQERLALLGQLAGGIAHELRHPVGVFKNGIYFLNKALEAPPPEVKETLKILDQEVKKSEQIITTLLDFARTGASNWQQVDLNDLIRAVVAGAGIAESSRVVFHLADSLPPIQADPDQLSRVFDNLVRNAMAAMSGAGQLLIRTEGDGSAFVTVSLSDTGEGIPPENLGRLFEPLFTTRAEGTGLGLGLAKKLVEAHGGSINVESEPGQGSTFVVRLPRARAGARS